LADSAAMIVSKWVLISERTYFTKAFVNLPGVFNFTNKPSFSIYNYNSNANKGVLGFWGFGEIGRASCRERV